MGRKEVTTIDGLFGSKTRVKLLHLFLNNPGKSFYVREITRLIDEQINSVRRELSNLLMVGVIKSSTSDNKLYYEIDQRYDFYLPFRAIFAGEIVDSTNRRTTGSAKSSKSTSQQGEDEAWYADVRSLSGLRVAIVAGALSRGSGSKVDLLLVGSLSQSKVQRVISQIESQVDRSINYATLSYDEFYYRMSVRDRFVNELLAGKHIVLVDTDKIINVESR